MSLAGGAHSLLVYGRRIRVLAAHLSRVLPEGASVLDVGAGDGLLDKALGDSRRDIRLRAVDVHARPATFVEVLPFDGKSIPSESSSYDAILLVDTLHHALDPLALLRESVRVARKWIIIKDHLLEGFLAAPTLRFMDWVGNARHGVALPYNYWSQRQWNDAFRDTGLTIETIDSKLRLYPFPASLLFDRHLHFIARLRKRD